MGIVGVVIIVLSLVVEVFSLAWVWAEFRVDWGASNAQAKDLLVFTRVIKD
jgi:hypothetical protein